MGDFDGIGIPPVAPTTQFQLVYDRDGKCWRTCLIHNNAPVSDANPLPVIAELEVSDIQIGAVEIKDHDTGLRLDVETVYDFHAAMVYDAVEYQKARTNLFGEDTVAKEDTSTLVTRTVAASKKYIVTAMLIGGDGAGIFRLKVDGSTEVKARNSGATRSPLIKFEEHYEASATQTILVEVESVESKTHDYEVTLFGYEVNV